MRSLSRGTPLLCCLFLLVLAAASSAFERTERRAPCAEFDPLRRPFFGDLHVHTAFSFDANALGVRATPEDAYRFALGEELGLRPYDEEGRGRRRARLGRPLDFVAVTDHAELLGEVHICQSPGHPAFDSLVCRLYRRWPLLAYYFVNSRLLNVRDPRRYSFCGPDGRVCAEAAALPWRRIREAAERFYDRSERCRFTTFVAYEWSGGPDGYMIHRNVIFRNDRVPGLPVSYVEEPTPEGLWRRLERECLRGLPGCDVVAIPHNSNLSGGLLFRLESLDAGEARRRAAREPLIEIFQHKGDSECGLEAAAVDELCAFEKLPFSRMDQRPFPFLWKAPPPSAFVRHAWKEGLLAEKRVGANPFKFGVVASTDTHMGTPGLVDEEGFPGHAAGGDTARVEIPVIPDALEFSPGGLAVLWAEENSRDALFEAMKRREAYGTSGPRILVRFFGGWRFDGSMCEARDRVARGYAQGVPMGGDLPPPESDAPTFFVWAQWDAGAPGRPGVPLQKIQIVKLWVSGEEAKERVYDVAGDPETKATVDPLTCRTQGRGYRELCAVWRDPEFDPSEPALYYARAVENPSCRWTGYVCAAHGVNCESGEKIPRELRVCCDPFFPRTVRERAWTSPVWYVPERSP